MRRSGLEHILRAASRIAGDREVVVIGSQSILGSFSENDLPDAAVASIHVTYGYYAQGVDITTATLPIGWRERIVRHSAAGCEGATGHCLDPHDLVVSKLVAYREKDLEFTRALLGAGLVDAAVLLDRARTLDVPVKRTMVMDWIAGWLHKYG